MSGLYLAVAAMTFAFGGHLVYEHRQNLGWVWISLGAFWLLVGLAEFFLGGGAR